MEKHWKRNTSNLKPFKKGQSGNPSGRAKTPEELLELKKHASHSILRHLLDHGTMTVAQLSARLDDKATTMLERVIGKIYTKAALGSLPHANVILERIAGPVQKSVTIEGNPERPLLPSLDGYSPETLTAIMIKLKKDAEAIECNSTPKSQEPLPDSSQQSLVPVLVTEL